MFFFVTFSGFVSYLKHFHVWMNRRITRCFIRTGEEWWFAQGFLLKAFEFISLENLEVPTFSCFLSPTIRPAG